MATSRQPRQPLVLRRLAEPVRDQVTLLAQAYDLLLRCGSPTGPEPALPAAADGHCAAAEPCRVPLPSLS